MNYRRSGGFALPTVLVASIVMMVVLLSAVSSTAAIRVSIREQYFNQMSRSSADAGAAYAQACLNANNGVPTWSDASPLKPGTDCTGTQLSGFDCVASPTDSRCYVSYLNNISSTFTVGLPKTSIIGWSTSNSQSQTTISSGQYHTCGLTISKRVFCWGRGAEGQLGNGASAGSLTPSTISTLTGITNNKVIATASGYTHSCVIAATGKAYCWGAEANGALGNNVTSGTLNTPVAVITTNLTGDKTFKAISAGFNHTCGIASDNKAYCWGRNTEGQLGNASNTDSAIPVAVSTAGVLSGKAILAISAGQHFTCALADGGTVACWGDNAYGQLGDNTIIAKNYPVTAAGSLSGKVASSLSAGQNHVCAITTDSLNYCWGYNGYGQIGDFSTTNRSAPVLVDVLGLASVSVSAGGNHTCVIASNNKAYCWGYNSSGQLGDASVTQRTSAVAVSTADQLNGKTILAISAGFAHTCVVASDDQAYCWGLNSDAGAGGSAGGMLGNNTITNSNIPVAVTTSGMTDSKAVSVVSKGKTSLLKTSNNTEWRSYSAYTKNDSASRVWKQVSPGYSHICAVTNDGQAYCWGKNDFGQLGDGTSVNKSSPTPVYMGTATAPGALYGKTILSISAGNNFTCALASDNFVYCWGSNSHGQLGGGMTIGVTYFSTSPIAVTTSTMTKTIDSITTGSDHACAITSLGLAFCWGSNQNGGQLGNSNNDVDSNVPVAVTMSGALSGLTILSISAGYYHTCFVASNNNAYCWGWNNGTDSTVAGQVGNSLTPLTDNPAPLAVYTTGVLSGKKILSITASGSSTCAIASDSEAYCWGRDNQGALGNDASNTDSYVPVAVSTAVAFSGKTILSSTGGKFHNCALASDNQAYCWGGNQFGQIGDNTGLDQSLPVPVYTTGVLTGKYVFSMSTSSASSITCAITSDARTYCWGQGIDSYGKIDSDFETTSTNSRVPVEVFTPPVSVY